MLSYYVIYYEKFKNGMQWTATEVNLALWLFKLKASIGDLILNLMSFYNNKRSN